VLTLFGKTSVEGVHLGLSTS